jgi:serine/threonine-protein kinase RsbW
MKKKFKFSSEIRNLALAESIVDSIAQKINLDEKYYGNILLSLSEAINNAIIHGNKLDSKKFVTVIYKIKDNILEISVEDEGNGFDPDSVPDPTAPENLEKETGRGLFIIKNLCDQVSFEKNGKLIKMKFFLK